MSELYSVTEVRATEINRGVKRKHYEVWAELHPEPAGTEAAGAAAPEPQSEAAADAAPEAPSGPATLSVEEETNSCALGEYEKPCQSFALVAVSA